MGRGRRGFAAMAFLFPALLVACHATRQAGTSAGDGDGREPNARGPKARADGGAGATDPENPPSPMTSPLAGELPDLPAPPSGDPEVHWQAWSLEPDVMHSAYDGVHTFQVPVFVRSVSTEPEQWRAEPADAVSFSHWQEPGEPRGVLITVERPVPRVLISVSQGNRGGYATLHITHATPEQWELGKRRHDDGVATAMATLRDQLRAMFPGLLEDLELTPDGRLRAKALPGALSLPQHLACAGCHGRDHGFPPELLTPLQLAARPDRALATLVSDASAWFGGQGTSEYAGLVATVHTWPMDDEEVSGLIVYLRSLTPDVPEPDPRGIPAACDPMRDAFDVQACMAQLPMECINSGPSFDLIACRAALGIDPTDP